MQTVPTKRIGLTKWPERGGLFFLTGRDLADLQCDLDMERKVLYTNAGGFI